MQAETSQASELIQNATNAAGREPRRGECVELQLRELTGARSIAEAAEVVRAVERERFKVLGR